MSNFDPHAALEEVLARKATAQTKYTYFAKHPSYETNSQLLLASMALDTNVLAEMKLREFIEAQRPDALPTAATPKSVDLLH